jgi:effector-binding domain-containing protein
MASEIEVRELQPFRLLVKKTTCEHSKIGPSFGAAIQQVGACMRASEAKMSSEPMAVYIAWREHDCDMAVGCQVEGNVVMSNGCEWFDVPGGPHACASHFGAYEAPGETHTAIRDWCSKNGFQPTGPCWESYPVDPGKEPDVNKWQTDVHYPVQKRA